MLKIVETLEEIQKARIVSNYIKSRCGIMTKYRNSKKEKINSQI